MAQGNTTDECGRPRRRPPRVSVRRLIVVAALTAVGVPLLLLAPSYIDEALYFRKHRELQLVVMRARLLALSAEDFRSLHGRYPASVAEFEALGGQGDGAYLSWLLDGARRLGEPIHTVSVPEPGPGDGHPLLVALGETGRVEILAHGGVRVTERFAPPPELRPSCLEVVRESGTGPGGDR